MKKLLISLGILSAIALAAYAGMHALTLLIAWSRSYPRLEKPLTQEEAQETAWVAIKENWCTRVENREKPCDYSLFEVYPEPYSPELAEQYFIYTSKTEIPIAILVNLSFGYYDIRPGVGHFQYYNAEKGYWTNKFYEPFSKKVVEDPFK